MNQIARPNVAPTREVAKPLKECRSLQEAFQTGEFMERIKSSLPRHLNPNAMLRTFIQATSKTPKILEVPIRQSLGAFLTLSELGLIPNNALGQAYLIPFEVKKWNPATRQREKAGVDLNVIIGYKGYLDLAHRSGMVGGIHADIVHPGDEFEYEYGLHPALKHKPMGKAPEGADPLYAYAVAHIKGAEGAPAPFKVLPWAEILKVRNQSQGYRSALYALEEAQKQGRKPPLTYTETPWVKHMLPMAMKTAWLRLSVWVPRSLETQVAELDEAQERGARVDFGAVLDGEASVIDGTIAIDEPTEEDPGSAFGMREQPEAPAAKPIAQPEPEPAKPAQAAQKPADKAPAPRQAKAPAKPAKPAFEAYVKDHTDDTIDGPYDDPVKFVKAFAAALGNADPEDRDAMSEANGSALDAAAAASAEAKGLIDALFEPAEEPADETDAEAVAGPVVIEVPVIRGKQDWPTWLRQMTAALADVGADSLTDWCAAQFPNIEAAPATTRLSLLKAIAQHAEATGAEMPPMLAQAVAPEAPKADRDAEQAADMARQFDEVQDAEALTALAGSVAIRTVMRRLKEDRPELFAQVDAAAARAKQRLGMA